MCRKGLHFGHLDNFSKFYLFGTDDSRGNDKIFDLICDDIYDVEINFRHVAVDRSSSLMIKNAV
jgi:hypothetical protein